MNSRPNKTMSLRERQRAQTYQHLLDVAADLIGTKGFNNTSISHLAEAAGASRATVYSYFETKEAIVEEITQVLWKNAEKIYHEFGELQVWDRSTILGWLTDSVLKRWERDIPYLRAAWKGNAKTFEANYGEYADRYIASFTKNSELWESRFTPTETRRRALLLISMVETYMSRLFSIGIEPDKPAAMETVANVFLDVLNAQK